ncbi:MAG TPA: SDR family NAD(P)-dependent oxidoreductase, partial [Actinomycetota bacterium]|nr:SDR family NAD(P)-dependent oxidoreductase [Actinomycetota bacterium]
ATAAGGRFAHPADASASVDPTPGLGLWGLARTIAAEYPDVVVRAVDVDLHEEPERIAAALLGELGTPGGAAVVGYRNETRSQLRLVRSELTGAPPGSGEELRAATEAIGLGPESVVLLTGGGRGITGGFATALAQACGCRIELLGRSPAPNSSEPAPIAAAADAAALRRAVVAQGIATPAKVEAEVRRILASRELRSTLETVGASAAGVRYHQADITDSRQVRQVVDGIFERWGRLDGLVHGAGVLEDRRIADKMPEIFARVFSTKVDGARALARALDGRPTLAFLVMFGSVSGVFGNPGQADYAAANDALDTLARLWQGSAASRRRVPSRPASRASELMPGLADIAPPVPLAARILSIDWGPWAAAAGGMVSPELERDYARRGIDMIAPEAGVAAMFRELAWGDPSASQVIYFAGPAGAFANPPTPMSSGAA